MSLNIYLFLLKLFEVFIISNEFLLITFRIISFRLSFFIYMFLIYDAFKGGLL